MLTQIYIKTRLLVLPDNELYFSVLASGFKNTGLCS